jgi:hypothetical protein
MTVEPGYTPDALAELGASLIGRYGPLMGSAALAEALGFSSVGAFRQACWRGKVNIQLFNLPGRNGRFALTQDVVRWLWAMRETRATEGAGR